MHADSTTTDQKQPPCAQPHKPTFVIKGSIFPSIVSLHITFSCHCSVTSNSQKMLEKLERKDKRRGAKGNNIAWICLTVLYMPCTYVHVLHITTSSRAGKYLNCCYYYHVHHIFSSKSIKKCNWMTLQKQQRVHAKT